MSWLNTLKYTNNLWTVLFTSTLVIKSMVNMKLYTVWNSLCVSVKLHLSQKHLKTHHDFVINIFYINVCTLYNCRHKEVYIYIYIYKKAFYLNFWWSAEAKIIRRSVAVWMASQFYVLAKANFNSVFWLLDLVVSDQTSLSFHE